MTRQTKQILADIESVTTLSGMSNLLRKLSMAISADILKPDMTVLSQMLRAVDKRCEAIAPEAANRHRPEVGQAKAAIKDQIHQLGILANRLPPPAPAATETTAVQPAG